MKLKDVKSRKDLEQLYSELNLTHAFSKTMYLKYAMGVIHTTHWEEIPIEDHLLSYEELVLDGLWDRDYDPENDPKLYGSLWQGESM